MTRKSYNRRKKRPTLLGAIWADLFGARQKNKSIGRESLTSDGVKVKSTIEKRIANQLTKMGVRFEYEHRIHFPDDTHADPDFYLPDYDIYIEYYGLIGHKNVGDRYRDGMAWKEEKYHRYGYTVIGFDPSDAAYIERSVVVKLRPILGEKHG